MDAASLDLGSTECARRRMVVRNFAPHLNNAALARQERLLLAIGIARVLLVFAVPTCVVFYLRNWYVKTPAAVLVAVVAGIELVVHLHRYFVLWPEGRDKRWQYWHEIEMAEDTYKLKIMGYYHRKIAKYTDSFPAAMTSVQIRRYYVTHGAVAFALFVAAYAGCVTLLARCRPDSVVRMSVLFLLSVGSGLVVIRFAKLHLINLPQVLALRQHPDFSNHLVPGTAAAEAIPFARPVASYSTEQRGPDAVTVKQTV